MSDELKPCPFCGCTVTRKGYAASFSGDVRFCNRCFSQALIDVWDQRPIEQALQSQLAKAQQELGEAREALRWYGANENWLCTHDDQYGDHISFEDLERDCPITKRKWVAGRRAREHLQKWGQG